MRFISFLINCLRRFWKDLDKHNLPRSCPCIPINAEKLAADRTFNALHKEEKK